MENEVLTTEFMEIVEKLNPHQKEILLALLKALLQNQERSDDYDHSND